MFYVYALLNCNGQLYFGCTSNLEKRIQEHTNGKVFTTAKYLPVKLIYYEAYHSEKDAFQREKMLKRYGSSWSQLRKRIRYSILDFQGRG